MKKFLSNYLFLFSIAGTIVLLDQWTKHLVRSNLEFGEMWSPWPWLEPYVRIWPWHNTGAAFGFLQGFNGVFMILAVLISAAIIYYFPQVPREDWLIRLALALELGGAVGNLIDRFTLGYVTDFVSVGRFAVFNVADASISTGVVLLILGVWMRERREKSAAQSPSPEAEQPDTKVGNAALPEELDGD